MPFYRFATCGFCYNCFVQKFWRHLLTTAAFHTPRRALDGYNKQHWILFKTNSVCTFSDSFCITADSALFSAIELLSFLAYFWLASWPGTRGTTAHCAITVTCNMHSYDYNVMHFATQASCQYWKQWLCLACKLS